MAKNDPEVMLLVSKVSDVPNKQLDVFKRAVYVDPTHREARKLYNALSSYALTAMAVVAPSASQKALRPAPFITPMMTTFAARTQSGSRAAAKCRIRARDPKWFRLPNDVHKSVGCGPFGGVFHLRAAHRMDAVPYTNGQ